MLPVSPPPDIDVELWHATIDEIERRAPERLALTHFGVVDRRRRPSRRLRSELDRWAALVAERRRHRGVRAARPTAEPEPTAAVCDEIAPFDQSWQGLRRYFDKRAHGLRRPQPLRGGGSGRRSTGRSTSRPARRRPCAAGG